jgi:predicted enzyme related to lactoylglutathione lyase
VSFWEINAQDGPALTAFYRRVFGWEASEEGSIPVFNLDSGGEDAIGGAIFTGQGRLPTHRCLYVSVEDVDAVCELVKREGQPILQGPFDFQGRLRLAFFRDPEGHMIGLSGPPRGDED